MKKAILTLTVTGILTVASLSVFGQENKKAAEARKDLREAKIDSAEDFRKFKSEAEMQISENQKKIAELKAKKSSNNKEAAEKYDKKILALEQKNNELKKKLEASSHVETSMWTSFKREFNHDMSELGHAIRDIGVDNAK